MKKILLILAAHLLLAVPVAAQVIPPSQTISVVDSGTQCSVAGSCAQWQLPNTAPSFTVQVTGTLTTVTLTFRGSADGITFFDLLATKLSTGVQATSTTTTGQYSIVNPGIVALRVVGTTVTSGAANLTLTRGSASSSSRAFPSFGSFVTGDILYASATNTISGLTAVASGQVLASAGTTTAPAYTATPSVTSVTVKGGTGTGTLKAGGIIAQMLTSITDASVQNQWNVGSVAIPANTLAVDGDTLQIQVAYTLATNANTKPYQLYFAASSATCSGSGATVCNSGCQLQSNSTTSSALSAIDIYTITRTSSGNQKYYGTLPITSSIQRTDLGVCAITDTAATQIAFGIRNNDAAAASVAASIINVWYFGK